MSDKLLYLYAQYKIQVGPLPDVSATPNRLQAILTILFTVIGALSLLMFTIGGFRYIYSQGDPEGTAKAKGTLIYATIGVLVSISAISVVTFIIGKL